jgi:uncharacterized membrane protein (DUF4010 family)
LTDVDAITLSMSRLQAAGHLDSGIAWRAIVVATLSNLAFKAGIVWGIGSRRLFAQIAGRFAIVIVIGILFMVVA